MKQRSGMIAFVTLVLLTIAAFAHEILCGLSWNRWLHSHRRFYVAESIDKIAGTLSCLATVWLLRGKRASVAEEIGLSAPIFPAVVFALIVSLPMLIGFALTRRFALNVDFFSLGFLTVVFSFVEEIEFRGFGLRQLQRGTGWPFWIVVWPSALLFGNGHVEKGKPPRKRRDCFS